MTNLLQMAGGQPSNKNPRFAPLFVDRMFTGLYSQRSVLHDPSDVVTAKFYGGRPDALWEGSNIELSNDLTLVRRPGLSEFSSATYPTPPSRFFSFHLVEGTIQLLVDCESTPTFVLTAAGNASAGNTVYTGTITGGANNAFVGMEFLVAGFDKSADNGTFTCTASTSTTLTLDNANGTSDTFAATAVSSGAIYLDNQDGTKTLIYAKSPGAGQAYFQSVADTCYIGDGVDQIKYTPGNENGTIWNWGIAAPTTQPSVVITESANASVLWTASTFFSTMGLLVDSNGNIEQLVSVNASGTNTTQYGFTGDGQPAWNNATGGTTSDNTVTWTCAGPLGLWTAKTTYNPGACIFVPNVGGTPIPSSAASGIRGLIYPGTTGGGIWCTLPGGTTGISEPTWNPTTDTGSAETTGWHWNYLGAAILWSPSTQYNSFWEWSNEVIVEPTLPTEAQITAGTQIVYAQTANNASTGSVNTPGISGTGYAPPWPADGSVAGLTTGDGDLIWQFLGTQTWAADTEYNPWTVQGAVFSAIVDSNGNFQVCTTFGTSGLTEPYPEWEPGVSLSVGYEIAVQSSSGWVVMKVTTGGTTYHTEPNWDYTTSSTTTEASGVVWTSQGSSSIPGWGTTYGSQTADGSVTWVNVGSATHSTWTSSTKWYLPAVGFAAPSGSQPYGGAAVVANADVQTVILSGKSSSTAPSWGTVGSQTIDNQATWYTVAAATTNSLSWTSGYVYAYSFKARALDDYYAPVADGGGGNIPPGVSSSVWNGGTPSGSESGGISTASPVFTITGSNTGAVNTISGLGSTDPQVDTIVIWRSADGGGASNMFELTEIPNPAPVNGQPGTWTFNDYLPDVATSVYPGLDNLIPAPIDDENDPPPDGYLPMEYNFQRVWGAVGETVYFSGGPDVIVGNPNECFNPSDEFPFLSTVIRCVRTPPGLLVFLTSSIEIIGGGPLTSSFSSTPFAAGLGLASFNALDIFGGEIYFLSIDSQGWTISPSLQLASIGFPIGNLLAEWDSSDAYVAVHQSGIDNAAYFADGSTGWFRLNPHQVPQNEQIWSPMANIVNGAQAVQSVETSPGVRQLLVGSTSINQPILKRDMSVWTDNGETYDAYFVMGSIVLTHPGEIAILGFIECDFAGVGKQPSVNYLLNEVSGNFINLPVSVYDPPAIYGETYQPTSYYPNRYYFAQTGSLARCRHMQIKVDFGRDTVQNELYDLTIFGRLLVEL